jgi:UDP-glucose 4-epimerase
MSRVLVTGGAGFIGSHVVDALRAAGHEPVIFDLRPSPYHAAGQVRWVRGNILAPEALQRAMAGCDAVFHLAAAADVDDVAADPASAEQLNARGTLNVLEAARAAGVERVLYASTIWVYSEIEHGPVDEGTRFPPPEHVYSATKLAGELYCRAYQAMYGLPCTILRFGIPYGPRARPAGVVATFVGRALAGESLTIQGGGEQHRRFVYVEDLAEGAVRALAPHAAGRTYNLVGDADVSVLELAETIRDVVRPVDIVRDPGRAGDFRGVEVSGERAAAELGWRPATSLREGIRRCAEWQAAEAPATSAVRSPLRWRAWRPGRAIGAVATVTAAVLAGMLAAALARYDEISDGASLLGLIALAGLPLALVSRIDWARDRRRAAVVGAGMLAGAGLTSVIVAVAQGLEHVVRHHAVLFIVVVILSVAAGGYAVRPATESG